MLKRLCSFTVVVAFATMSAGCVNGVIGPGGGDASAVSEVSTKALDVASQVGGANGFGGALMDGYASHMPGQMGFHDVADLAPEATNMMVLIRNESDEAGTFHLSYFASHMGLDDQVLDVVVGAGEEVTVEIPCSEIVGIGPLEQPGEPGCHLDDGKAVDNVMAVPGFLGQDFVCNGTYECVLTQDVNDLDGDGDTEELIIVSDAMEFHMTNGGPMGHGHGTGPGMMGSHMGM